MLRSKLINCVSEEVCKAYGRLQSWSPIIAQERRRFICGLSFIFALYEPLHRPSANAYGSLYSCASSRMAMLQGRQRMFLVISFFANSK